MNIYADRGNLLVLEHRCLWRGIGFELSSSGLDEPLSPDAHDLYYLGGGQDRDQRLCAEVGLLDVRTVREDGPRLIGNVAIEVSLGEHDVTRVLAGFENHGGRTYLEPDAHALGRVLRGHGNDGRSGLEGALHGNTIGTYLHGPLLPKNTWFADWLIATALHLDPSGLIPLDDAFEQEAHLSARRAVGIS
jgi:hypothetical protein